MYLDFDCYCSYGQSITRRANNAKVVGLNSTLTRGHCFNNMLSCLLDIVFSANLHFI